MSSDRRPIGQALDSIGVTARLDDDELIDGAIVILRVIEADGSIRHTQAWSNGLDWITRRGLVEIARDTARVSEGQET